MRIGKLVMLGSFTMLFALVAFVASCQIMPSGPNESENVSIAPNTPLFADDGITFTPHHHTLIIKAIGDNMLGDYGVIAHLADRDNFTGSDVLRAVLEVESIPDSIKEKIRVVLKYAPALEQALQNIPEDLQARLDEIKSKLEQAESPEDAIVILRELKVSGKYKDIKGMDEAFDFGIAIIEDGMGSIYSPDYVIGYACDVDHSGGNGLPEPDTSRQDSTGNNEPTSNRDSTDYWYDPGELVEADIMGAISGAIAGSLAPGLGTFGGGIAGAFSFSAADFTKQILFAILNPD